MNQQVCMLPDSESYLNEQGSQYVDRFTISIGNILYIQTEVWPWKCTFLMIWRVFRVPSRPKAALCVDPHMYSDLTLSLLHPCKKYCKTRNKYAVLVPCIHSPYKTTKFGSHKIVIQKLLKHASYRYQEIYYQQNMWFIF